MRSYQALSGSYDALMRDAHYARRAAFLGDLLRESPIPVRDVLDLGCGAGAIAWALYRQGFRVTAADASEEMLTEAVRRGEGAEPVADPDVPPPLFVRQSMQRLRLPAPVDGVVSTLDSVNYLTRGRDLRETFRRVARCLSPGGRFLFDVNTPYRLRSMDQQIYMDETDGSFCVWRTFFSEKKKVCVWQVDLFQRRPDGAWDRAFEEHRERAWSMEELEAALRDAGFSNVRFTGDLSRKPPEDDEIRWNVLAEKEIV